MDRVKNNPRRNHRPNDNAASLGMTHQISMRKKARRCAGQGGLFVLRQALITWLLLSLRRQRLQLYRRRFQRRYRLLRLHRQRHPWLRWLHHRQH